MSAIKEVLGDIDLERLAILLMEDNNTLIEDIELYNNVGGNETYQMWAIVYGYELAENWFETHGDNPIDKRVVDECTLYVFKSYIQWLRNLNY